MRESSKRSIRPSRAVSGSREPRISSITSSMFAIATAALEDVQARLALAQLVLRAAHDHVALVVDVVLDDRQQAERARHAVDQGDHVHAEGRLQLGVLVELVEDDLRDRVALELDHEPDAGLVGLVAEVEISLSRPFWTCSTIFCIRPLPSSRPSPL